MQYLFIFGNTPRLSSVELSQVLEIRKIPFEVIVETPMGSVLEIDKLPDDFFKLLGGIVKMAKVVGRVEADKVAEYISQEHRGAEKIVLGMSVYGGTLDLSQIKDWLSDIKHELQTQKVRYILPHEGTNLSPVVVTKQKVQEYIVFAATPEDNNLYLAKTLSVSDFANWSKRDYGRPKVDPHLGMLPPRVARMMVNLAGLMPGQTLLDPFCGVGTVLMEGLMENINVIGADLNPSQVQFTEENLQWLKEAYSLKGNSQTLVADARRIGDKLETRVNAIVTEPDLGPVDMERKQYNVANINRQLIELYTNSLLNWKEILEPSGRVVMALPSFGTRSKFGPSIVDSTILTTIIDKAKLMGYSVLDKPIVYSREQALVQRNICIFGKIN